MVRPSNLDVLQHFQLQAPKTFSATGVSSTVDLHGLEGDLVVTVSATPIGSSTAKMMLRLEQSETTKAEDFEEIFDMQNMVESSLPDLLNESYFRQVIVKTDAAMRYLRLNIYNVVGNPSTVLCATAVAVKKNG
ncbi:MAG: hypothetical protein ERJ68_00130 [Aphanocapsa feldmannii 277cI]|uniref:Uncharacterized protein n=1 Tax=Aphanocapsa feldmannii 277cI TaxID=2507554 RepID=A0A524RWI8_9CHRO|nr:MAG: hypothetical protein ERJ68_00130 [Aphanocapsa feldmannii 277cI]